nr:MAG TPA: hypothetical protein [Caudoviricetes sp.]
MFLKRLPFLKLKPYRFLLAASTCVSTIIAKTYF